MSITAFALRLGTLTALAAFLVPSVSRAPDERLHAGSVASVAAEPVRPPTLAQLAAENQKAPHLTPSSLLEFAEILSDRMSRAAQSAPEARDLFQELRQCVLRFRSQTSPVAQALCLNQADRLARLHQELSPEFQRLFKRASPEARDLFGPLSVEM
jgi:hypothetical protein